MANPTCLDIITDAFEEANIRAVGDAPSPEEAARGMTRLQYLWNAGVEQGVFGRVEEYLATANYTAEEGQRVYSAGYTITLPTTISDEDTGENRRPRDFAMVQVVNAATDPQISLYDAHEAEWVRVDNLALQSECPFGRRYRLGLAAALASMLSGPFLRNPGGSVQASAALLRSALSLRLSAPQRDADVTYY